MFQRKFLEVWLYIILYTLSEDPNGAGNTRVVGVGHQPRFAQEGNISYLIGDLQNTILEIIGPQGAWFSWITLLF